MTAAIAAVIASYSMLFAPMPLAQIVVGKEMLLENIGAVCYLGASIVSFMAVRKVKSRDRSATRWKRVTALLGLLFFFAAGEELSWGQRLFRFSTPEPLKRYHTQGDFSLHNLEIFDTYTIEKERKRGISALVSANRMADLFMLTLFVTVPFLWRFWPAARKLLERFGLPVLPSLFALPHLLNLGFSILSEAFVVNNKFLHMATSETREFNYALLCLLAAWYFLEAAKRGNPWPGGAGSVDWSPSRVELG